MYNSISSRREQFRPSFHPNLIMAEDLYTLCFPSSSELSDSPCQINWDELLKYPDEDRNVPDSICELNWDELLKDPDDDKILCKQQDKKRRRIQSIVLSERKRRTKMEELYSTLQSLIPFFTNT